MKKVLGIFILGVIFISMSASIVSAEDTPTDTVANAASNVYTELMEPILRIIVGGDADGARPEFFLTKIMFAIIIFAVIWKSLEKVPFFSDSSWVLWVVSIAVSLVSVRWLGDINIVQAILLPYSALGIALAAGIPFVIYFFMTVELNKTMRKVSWVFFIVIFVALWFTRRKYLEGFEYIYLITAALGLAVLKFDGTIHKIKQKIDAEKGMHYKELERKHRIMDDLDDARDTLTKIIDRDGSINNMKKAKAHIKVLEAELATLP